jgi:hypothetical protein
LGKKKKIFAKKINHIFSNTLNIFFKLPKFKGLIQILACASEKHNYINLAFETNANNG